MSNSYFGGNGQAQPRYFDPLGPNAANKIRTPTGGPEQRDWIFGQMTGDRGAINGANQNFISGLNSAAYDPARSGMRNYVSSVLGGNYLHGSPELDSAMGAMRSASAAEGANDAGRVRSQFAQNGMSFGTGNQEAQDNATTSRAAAEDSAEAQARLANYQQERQYQEAAPGEMEKQISAPLNYLQAIPQAYLSPLSSMAQLTQGLAGGGSIATPTPYQTQGLAGQISNML